MPPVWLTFWGIVIAAFAALPGLLLTIRSNLRINKATTDASKENALVAAQSAEHIAEITSNTARIVSMEAQFVGQQKLIMELTDRADKVKDELAETKRKLDKVEQDFVVLQEENAALYKDNHTLKESNALLQMENHELRQEVVLLKSENQRLQMACTQWESIISEGEVT